METAHGGDYWRLLVPGKYEVSACAQPTYGCVKKVVTITNPDFTEAQRVDFVLPLAASENNIVRVSSSF